MPGPEANIPNITMLAGGLGFGDLQFRVSG